MSDAKLCPYCEKELAEEGVQVKRKGEPVLIHKACKWDIDRKVEEREKSIRDYCKASLSRLPSWDFARVDNPELEKFCRSKRLRGVAAKYTFGNGNVTFIGPAGIGKTVGIVALIHRLHDRAVEAALAQRQAHYLYQGDGGDLSILRDLTFRSAHDLVKARRESLLGQGEAELVTKAKRCQLLVIDELGFESKNDEVLFEILDERYLRNRITWVTSGSTSVDLKQRYGSGFWRRLTERGVVVEES